MTSSSNYCSAQSFCSIWDLLLRHLGSWRIILMARGFTAATLEADGVAKGGAEKQAALIAATKELERTFNKTDFKQMKVILIAWIDVFIAFTSVVFHSFGYLHNELLAGCCLVVGV